MYMSYRVLHNKITRFYVTSFDPLARLSSEKYNIKRIAKKTIQKSCVA